MENEFINPNGQNFQPVDITRSRRPSNIWLIIVAALFIIVPFLTWYLTWFGRGLSDDDIAKYLVDENNPRHMQRALLQPHLPQYRAAAAKARRLAGAGPRPRREPVQGGGPEVKPSDSFEG